MIELIERRQGNSKTFKLGAGKRRLVISGGAVHYKDDYSNSKEPWKDIDTTIVSGRVDKAPFILTINPSQKSIHIVNKKDGAECTLRLTGLLLGQSHAPMGVSAPVIKDNTVTWKDIATDTDIVILVDNERIKFQHILKSDKAPNTAVFTAIETGKSYLEYKAYDAKGAPIAFESTKVGDTLTEKIDLSKISAAQYPIEIDPTWSVAAVADDALRRLSTTLFLLNDAHDKAGCGGPGTDTEYGCGLRFTNITIPNGSTIDNGTKLIMTCRTANSAAAVNTRVSAEDIDDAPDFSGDNGASFDIRFGNHTTARIDWDNIPAWSVDEVGPDTTSPEIKSVIQEIVVRGGWASGQDIVIFWEDFDGRSTQNPSTWRQAYSRDSSATKQPQLTIEFTPPPPPGWTGKIAGVTDPAKIMGVDKANIAEVKGVA